MTLQYFLCRNVFKSVMFYVTLELVKLMKQKQVSTKALIFCSSKQESYENQSYVLQKLVYAKLIVVLIIEMFEKFNI